MSFLASRELTAPAVGIVGVPYDATSSFRPGSRRGPAAIRWASQSIETYSPILDRDLEAVAVTDFGDLPVEDAAPEAAVDTVRAWVSELPQQTLPMIFGGEHTITLGAVQALHARHPDLAVLQFDAHTDLRDDYDGRHLSHATVMRRVLETVGNGSIVQLGIRAGSREEFALAHDAARHSAPRMALPTTVWTWLEERPLYVTLDIDVIDPAAAPGTGNPEPEGVSVTEILAVIRRLGYLRVVGFDLVEVSPPLDPTGQTAVLAAVLAREAILSFQLAHRPHPA